MPARVTPARPSKGKDSAKAATKRLSGYQRSKEAGAQVLPVKLPLAYLAVLESEAKLMHDRRGQFLEKLLHSKLGELPYERPRSGPAYEPTDEDLLEKKVWTWYIQPEVREMLEADRLQMGLPSVGAWIVTMLNQWIGRPGGLRTRPR
jgi:hypothetical protein